MNYYNEHTMIWLNGSFIKAAEAKLDLYSQTMHYGFGVFEGIRSYRTATGETRIFKAEEHFTRLQKSAETLSMPYPYSSEELIEATYKVLEMNGQQDAYIRPLVYAPANMSFVKNTESNIAILTWEMAPFLGEKLIRVMSSSYQRPNPKGFHITAKAVGHYVNSLLASYEAKSNGYDEALLSDINGFLAEAPGANLFFEKDGVLYTPAPGNILPGITRATVKEICEEMNIHVVEKQCSFEELLDADAAFFCGTAAEVIGWASIDNKPFHKEWNDSISRKIQIAYKDRVTEKIAEPTI
ncbi:MAG TPA: branched-chain amino acid transaminase [Chitinophagaceae bacterium]|nr:branched-chain amino acid transaminase [Chitinophagaceae bacterium]